MQTCYQIYEYIKNSTWFFHSLNVFQTRRAEALAVSLAEWPPLIQAWVSSGHSARVGRQPWMEDELWWKTTLDGRWPLMEDNLGWKTTLDGRWALMEEDLGWKMTLDGWGPWMEDDLGWKITYDRRRLYVLRAKTTLKIFSEAEKSNFAAVH